MIFWLPLACKVLFDLGEHGYKHMHKVEVCSGASWPPNCIILSESLLLAAAFMRGKKKKKTAGADPGDT